MSTWPLIDFLLVTLLVGGSAAFVVRAAWRSVRSLSQPAGRGHAGCTGCSGNGCRAGERIDTR